MSYKIYTNWNKYPLIRAQEISFTHADDLEAKLCDNDSIVTPRGNGRSYGDASLGSRLCSTLRYNKILAFDMKSGILQVQSGVLLSDILEVIVPKGWFLPVTPGTKFITAGGAVSADVHGKNHHSEGGFSRHLICFDILLSHGEVLTCSREQHQDLFKATCGGMGLTGVVLNVTFRLKQIETSYIAQRHIKAKNINEILDLFDQHSGYTYSVAWIDCLKQGRHFGRSILMLGEHARANQVNMPQEEYLKLPEKKKVQVPFNMPSVVLNTLFIKMFNQLYYSKSLKRDKTFIGDYENFFYPLDSLLHWNRMYGKKGFIQYQFVLPKSKGKEGMIKILELINKKGWGSFLAVLKAFGPEDEGFLSFPMEGYTLALDFPIRKGLFQFLEELDQQVLAHGGRLYLAKDARMKPETFHATCARLGEFREVVQRYNPLKKINTELSKRLQII